MVKADSGMKFDEGKINKVLALTIELSDYELGVLVNKLREEQSRRNMKSHGRDNLDTIRT